MIPVLARLFTPRHAYPTELRRQRAAALLLVFHVLIALQFIVLGYAALARLNIDQTIVFANIVGLVMLLVQIRLVHVGRLELAVWVFIVETLALSSPFVLTPGINLNFIVLFIPLIMAGALLDRRGTLIVLAIVITLLTLRFINQTAETVSLRVTPADLLAAGTPVILITVGFNAVVLLLFSGATERIAQAGLEDIRQLRAIAAFNSRPELYQRLSGIRRESDVDMQEAVRLLEDDLGYTLAQIYLIAGGQIVRRVRKGSVAPQGSFVLTENEARFVRDAIVMETSGPLIVDAAESLDAARFLTPPARAAVLFPLREEGRTVGVLEVQTSTPGGFNLNQIEALRALADTLADLIYLDENFTALQTTLLDQQQILERVRLQLSEAQQRSERAIIEGWRQFLDSRGRAQAIGYDVVLPDATNTPLQTVRPIPASDLPAEIRDALRRGEIVVEREGADQIVKAPITLRGEVLGAMSFRIAGDNPLTDRQLELVRTISDRLAVALESARLYEQSQNLAQRERRANEIASELLTATNVETLMSLAAERFNEALGAVYTRVTLEPGALAEPPLSASANGDAGSDRRVNGGGAHDRG
jgi:GAF domain-containing protein